MSRIFGNRNFNLIDPYMKDLIHILSPHQTTDDPVKLHNFLQSYYKSANYYDKLQEKNAKTDIITVDQAKQIIELTDRQVHQEIPVIPPETENNVVLIIPTSAHIGTISLRIYDILKFREIYPLVNEVFFSYLNPTSEFEEEFDLLIKEKLPDMIVHRISDLVTEKHTFSEINRLRETKKVVLICDRAFRSKMMSQSKYFGTDYLGLAYFNYDEKTKASYYGYDLDKDNDLCNWAGNIINFSLVRAFDNHYRKIAQYLENRKITIPA